MPQVVPESALTSAITWNSSGFQVASVVGPAWAAASLAWPTRSSASTGGRPLFGGVCRPRAFDPTHSPPRGADDAGPLLAGVSFMRGSPLILATITLDLFAVLLGGSDGPAADFAVQVLGRRSERLRLAASGPPGSALPHGRHAGPPTADASRRSFGFSMPLRASEQRRSCSACRATFALSFLMLMLTEALDDLRGGP